MTRRLFGILLFAAVAAILSGLAGLLWYETYAYATGGLPTLSALVAHSIDVAPAHLAVWVAATAGLLTGILGTLLALHFARLLPWWRP